MNESKTLLAQLQDQAAEIADLKAKLAEKEATPAATATAPAAVEMTPEQAREEYGKLTDANDKAAFRAKNWKALGLQKPN